MAAEAVYHAVRHDVGRELLVAWPTLKAVVGNKFVPGYIDRKLAREGYDAQQTEAPARDRPNNLWEPAPGDWGAHGRFDDRSRRHSWELTLRLNREWLLLAGAGLAGLALGVARSSSGNGAAGSRSRLTSTRER